METSDPKARRDEAEPRPSLPRRGEIATAAGGISGVHDCVVLDSRVESIRQDDIGVEAILADRRRITGDVLVGADGVHSRVRDAVIGAQQPRFTGHVAYRMLLPRSAFQNDKQPAPAVTLWMGPHGHVVSYWVRGGEL